MKKLLPLVMLFSMAASARHLESRTGFGMTLHSYGAIPALSMHYHMTDYQSAVVMGGVNTDDDVANFELPQRNK